MGVSECRVGVRWTVWTASAVASWVPTWSLLHRAVHCALHDAAHGRDRKKLTSRRPGQSDQRVVSARAGTDTCGQLWQGSLGGQCERLR
jgi:hypothetical protein